MIRAILVFFVATGLLSFANAGGAAEPAPLHVGAAKIDITPDGPIRLCGYAARATESDGPHRPLYARAVAITAGEREVASVLVTIDATAVTAAMTEEVARRLKEKAGVSREQLVVTCTHTHAAPCLTGATVNLFGAPIPADQQRRIDRYARRVVDGIEEAALAAIRARRPAHLSHTSGRVGFAANRRTTGGPVDHSLPVLAARAAEGGAIRVVVANYACHCTTLGPETNHAHGDWAGRAAEILEGENAGAVAMVTIGCGADANPAPRGKMEHVEPHARALADEVKRLLAAGGAAARPITAAPRGAFTRIELPFDKLPDAHAFRKLAQSKDAPAGNARLQLARFEKDGKLPAAISYPVQSWTFGEDLAMVFLGGEVVVDYALRLGHDFDPGRLWVTAYANDVQCYIPSRRVLAEGGYEAEGAMVYYGQPGRLAPGVENDIVRTVHALVPPAFRSRASLDEFPLPKSVPDAVAAFKLADDLVIEPIAAEPLVESPIAIDWGVDGRLWVVEMRDYPSGMNENGTPGGRIKTLEDTDGDGRYEKATVFLDHLPFPQGVMPWRKGALVCAAPDILYAEDTDGDGRADVVRKLFSGFGPDNQQWAVNGLTWGLDNLVHGASSINNDRIRVAETGKTIELGGRDFRMNPETLHFEPAAGRTQFNRVRDDWGNWFGNDNSTPLWHYPVPETYARRNPHVPPPPTRVAVSKAPDPTRLYPISRTLLRFNNPESANGVTSACGPTIYRDTLLGNGFHHNAFFCEPVHNVVQRLTLAPSNITFAGHRAPDNAASEFLASTDNWFRPVQTRTGPDGALYVVDMYRFVIEHPRWITADRLAMLDTRAGADRGRIYRIRPRSAEPRKIENLAKLPTADLAARLDDPNGPTRDLVHRELFQRQDEVAVPRLQSVANTSKYPAARLQALAALEGLQSLTDEFLLAALSDSAPEVCRYAISLAEPRLAKNDRLAAAIARFADGDPTLRHQTALAAGAMPREQAARLLAKFFAQNLEDPWLRAAVANSAIAAPLETFDAATRSTVTPAPARNDLLAQLAALTAAAGEPRDTAALIARLNEDIPVTDPAWRFATLAKVLDQLDRRRIDPGDIARVLDLARGAVADESNAPALRVAATTLLARDPAREDADLRLLTPLLQPAAAPALQSGALTALARLKGPRVAPALLAAFPALTPSVRPRALEVLAGRPGGPETLLAAVESGTLHPTAIPPGVREKLLTLPDAVAKARAVKLLTPGTAGPRAKVIADLAAAVAPLKGDPTKGAALFAQTCASCHRFKNTGHAVGPDLAALRDRSTSALLTAIVDPNAAVDGRYVAYYVETTDDRSLSGLITDETAAGFTVLQGNGVRDAVTRNSVRTMYSTRLSIMPEGLEQMLTPPALADLIAHLQAP